MTPPATWILPSRAMASMGNDAVADSEPQRSAIPIRPAAPHSAPAAGAPDGAAANVKFTKAGSLGLAPDSLDHYSDLELLRSAADGNTAAFHLLMDRHAKSLFRMALSLSKTRSDAEDICQEAFIGAFRALHGFEGKASVKTWLTRILIRRAAKHWHKTRHDRRTLSLHAPSEEDQPERHDAMPTTESRVAAVDHQLDLKQLINSLSPEYRQVIVLREMQGLSYEEIATTLAIPRGTVESRLHRARAELRVLLKDYKPAGVK